MSHDARLQFGRRDVSPANGNSALYFVDRHILGFRGDKVAFVEGNRTLTYGRLAFQSGQLSHLYERHGLQPEDRAALIVLDTLEFPIIFWGSLKAGVIPIPLNTLLPSDQYEFILNDSRAKALFVSRDLLGAAKQAIDRSPYLKAIFVIGEGDHDYSPFSSALAACESRPAVNVAEDSCAFWLYSSGSTGKPKGVRHVHSSLKATADTYGAQILGIDSRDIIHSSAKLFFAYGLGNAMTFPMSVGATTALSPVRPTPESVLQVMAATRPTIYCGVPTLYAALLAAIEDASVPGLDRLRRCISAGESLPEELGQRWHGRTGVEILDGVGSTEMLHIYLSNTPGKPIYGTSGQPVPGYELRLVDEDGRDVGIGEIGELLVKGPSAADGYWNQREKTRSTFEGNWTRTGDKFELRADGRFIYRGRNDDMFKVSGIWVSPFEIESAISSHPDVLEVAVVSHLDDNGLEKPKAFVVLKNHVDAEQFALVIKEYVKEKVGKWKYPRWIQIVDDLPKTATGKLQRFKLRQGMGNVR
jgi:4-hydroxybenzoate-CoA ligase